MNFGEKTHLLFLVDAHFPRSSSGIGHCGRDLSATLMREGVRWSGNISQLRRLGRRGDLRQGVQARHRRNLREDSHWH